MSTSPLTADLGTRQAHPTPIRPVLVTPPAQSAAAGRQPATASAVGLSSATRARIVLAVCALVCGGVGLAGLLLMLGGPVALVPAAIVSPAVAACDLRSRQIPDVLVLTATLATMLISLPEGTGSFIGCTCYTLGTLLVGGLLWLCGPDQMMGLGDVKVSALYAAALTSLPGSPVDHVLWGVLLGPAALALIPALAARNAKRPLPYAPFLAVGFGIVALAPGLLP